MQVFFSWQSDTPSLIGRNFIKRALDGAVKQLTKEMELIEAERITIDQDTQGVLGSPAIAETIFKKIQSSDVIVADVTIVGKTTNGKKLINSNVAYELGYAHGTHSDHVLLNVMNLYFGDPDELPFDLRHRRWPLTFNLNPSADIEQRSSAKRDLEKQLASILRQYIEHLEGSEEYIPTTSTFNPAVYWPPDEPLVDKTNSPLPDTPLILSYKDNQPLIYMRVWSQVQLKHISGAGLHSGAMRLEPLLERTTSSSFQRNKYGAITYSFSNEFGLIATSQIFKNREIWGTEAYILRDKGLDFNYLPITAFEKGIIKSLKRYIEKARQFLHYPDIAHVEIGLVNVEGFMLAMPNHHWEKYEGPLYDDVITQSKVNIHDENSINNALVTMFDAVFDAAGLKRPEHFSDFPPPSSE